MDTRRHIPPNYKPQKGDRTSWDVSVDFNTQERVLPDQAVAVSFNVTVTNTEGAGFLTIYDTGPPVVPPKTSTVNWWQAGQTIANSGIVAVGRKPEPGLYVGVLVGGNQWAKTNYIIDITGYFT
jgi:hypothetical protein